jgi:hypothetical protein
MCLWIAHGSVSEVHESAHCCASSSTHLWHRTKIRLHCTNAPVIMFGMATHRHKDERRILRCAACDGTVLAEIAGFGRADANTACASCGMTLVDSPLSGGDYFDVIMRVGRPIWRGARLRRAG